MNETICESSDLFLQLTQACAKVQHLDTIFFAFMSVSTRQSLTQVSWFYDQSYGLISYT